MRRRRRRRSEDLFLDELGEEAFGLNGGDIATIIPPNENAAFDVEKEEGRGCPCHWSLIWMVGIGSDMDQIRSPLPRWWWWYWRRIRSRYKNLLRSSSRWIIVESFWSYVCVSAIVGREELVLYVSMVELKTFVRGMEMLGGKVVESGSHLGSVIQRRRSLIWNNTFKKNRRCKWSNTTCSSLVLVQIGRLLPFPLLRPI